MMRALTMIKKMTCHMCREDEPDVVGEAVEADVEGETNPGDAATIPPKPTILLFGCLDIIMEWKRAMPIRRTRTFFMKPALANQSYRGRSGIKPG